jgi:hypothetical protein
VFEVGIDLVVERHDCARMNILATGTPSSARFRAQAFRSQRGQTPSSRQCPDGSSAVTSSRWPSSQWAPGLLVSAQVTRCHDSGREGRDGSSFPEAPVRTRTRQRKRGFSCELIMAWIPPKRSVSHATATPS